MSRLLSAAVILSACLLVGLILVFRPRTNSQASTYLTTLNQVCTDNKISVAFAWQLSDTTAKEQWVDLSMTNGDFAAGAFSSNGPLSGQATSFVWTGIQPSTVYYSRINRLLPDGTWETSPTTTFQTINCSSALALAQAATPTPSPSVPTPTPIQPSPTPLPQPVYTLVGFSDHATLGGPPPDVIKPGGVLQSCNPLQVYAFVRYANLPATQEYFVTWAVNNNALLRAKETFVAPAGSALLSYPVDDGTKATYTVRLQIDRDKPPVLEGSFTLAC
jgi:hypothetical protein